MVASSKQHGWTDADVVFLRKNYGKISCRDIAAAIGISSCAVTSKANRLGLTIERKERLPADEVKHLKAEGLTIAQIAVRLNLTIHQVGHCLYQVNRNNPVFTPRSRLTWNRETVALLVQLVKANTPIGEIAKKLHGTPNAIRVKASTLGLILPHGKKSYSQLDVDLAHTMKDAGFSVQQIARKLDDPPISVHTVRRILSNESPSWELL